MQTSRTKTWLADPVALRHVVYRIRQVFARPVAQLERSEKPPADCAPMSTAKSSQWHLKPELIFPAVLRFSDWATMV
jgi:hypothetical protein